MGWAGHKHTDIGTGKECVRGESLDKGTCSVCLLACGDESVGLKTPEMLEVLQELQSAWVGWGQQTQDLVHKLDTLKWILLLLFLPLNLNTLTSELHRPRLGNNGVHLLQLTLFVLSMTIFVLNMTGFVPNMAGFVQSMTGIILNITGCYLYFSWLFCDFLMTFSLLYPDFLMTFS